ncbi:hypothetical protein EYF80_034942 [Liparis tanakae]|uniref:Uncharacterized protein n=1 Tax=Liparis tanakae TaxID=230148 RepID=A0A4Z2GPX5_9TELE|nr:hypothetical protein EYF80_034942 [Liparis tanakae]
MEPLRAGSYLFIISGGATPTSQNDATVAVHHAAVTNSSTLCQTTHIYETLHRFLEAQHPVTRLKRTYDLKTRLPPDVEVYQSNLEKRALNAPRVSPTCRPSVTKTIQTQTPAEHSGDNKQRKHTHRCYDNTTAVAAELSMEVEITV